MPAEPRGQLKKRRELADGNELDYKIAAAWSGLAK